MEFWSSKLDVRCEENTYKVVVLTLFLRILDFLSPVRFHFLFLRSRSTCNILPDIRLPLLPNAHIYILTPCTSSHPNQPFSSRLISSHHHVFPKQHSIRARPRFLFTPFVLRESRSPPRIPWLLCAPHSSPISRRAAPRSRNLRRRRLIHPLRDPRTRRTGERRGTRNELVRRISRHGSFEGIE